MKWLMRIATFGLCRLLVMPLAYPIRWLGFADNKHLIFQFGSQMMSLIPGVVGVYLRREYYLVVLHLNSENLTIEFGTIFAPKGLAAMSTLAPSAISAYP